MAQISVTLLASDNSANTTVISLNTAYIQDVSLPVASEVAAFSTAAAAITYINKDQNETRTRRYLTASTVAAINSAIASASAGVLGGGVSGDAVLVAGTVAVTIPGLTTASKVILTRHIANTVTLTVEYQYAVTANTLTITAAVAAGTINVADVSTITYCIVG